MKIVPAQIPDVKLIYPDIHRDARGYFLETFHQQRYLDALGISTPFVQDNLSHSKQGTLRGLHFQNPNAQGKLITVLAGKVFDVAVDIRTESPTFSKWVGLELSSEDHTQVWVPPGFAHGFLVLTEAATVTYKCTTLYSPEDELTLLWNDEGLGIGWAMPPDMVSEKDKQGRALQQLRSLGLLPNL